MNPEERALVLQRSLSEHRKQGFSFYDEVVAHVSQRAKVDRSLGKADIGALVVWKRLNASTRWADELMKTSDQEVREATAMASELALDQALDTETAASRSRSALTPLPGFKAGDALASAVLYALAPARMAVYDRRAQSGLERLGLVLTARPGRYGRYMALVEQMILETSTIGAEMSSREIDLALFTLGGSATG